MSLLLFRDRLRLDPVDRDRYAAVKRELAAQHWRHVQNYAAAKTALVGEIVARAYGRSRRSDGRPDT